MINSNKQLKQYYANEINLVKDTVTPKCIHFGVCGGCAMQHIPYSKQLEIKTNAVRAIMQGVEVAQQTEVAPSPIEYGYRSRMDYVTALDPIYPPLNRMGLRRKKRFNMVEDLSECYLLAPEVFLKTRKIFDQALKIGFMPYDLVKHTGDFRYLVVRVAPTSQMLSIVTKQAENEPLVEQLAQFALSQGFNSVHWLHNPTDSDVSYADSVKFWGEEYLTVESQSFRPGTKFNLGPNNFFQSNLVVFEQLLEFVTEQLGADTESQILLDLYSGVGTIGILLADQFAKVVGIEIVASSVELANCNAQLNGITNVEYSAGDLGAMLETGIYSGLKNTVAIIDPPRTGVGQKGVEELLKLAPAKIVYISCNPITQRADLDLGLLGEYEITAARGFDMFPQTLHLEHVIVLTRR